MLHFLSRLFRSTGEFKEAQWKVAVAVGVLVEVILVIFLGGVEAVEWQHLGDDWLEVALGFDCYTLFNNWQVGRVGVVDASAVLRSHVVSLLVLEGGVDGFEIHIEQELESNFLGVINHLHSLGMSSGVGAHLLITRVLYCAVGISYLSVDHSVNQFEKMLSAPKAPASQINFSCHNCLCFYLITN